MIGKAIKDFEFKMIRKLDKKTTAVTEIVKSDMDNLADRMRQDIKRKVDVSEKLLRENIESQLIEIRKQLKDIRNISMRAEERAKNADRKSVES